MHYEILVAKDEAWGLILRNEKLSSGSGVGETTYFVVSVAREDGWALELQNV